MMSNKSKPKAIHSASLEAAIYYRQARFTLSAPKLEALGEDAGLEVAFAGRSNAGKSTALNAITDQKQLARTSKTPGRTQEIVLFELDSKHRLADLPGYGYAKVSKQQKARWDFELERYFQQRESLCGLFLIMDIRHPLRPGDWQMISWCKQAALPSHVLLTKADKVTRNVARATIVKVANELEQHEVLGSVQTFSGASKDGVADAHEVLDRWFSRPSSSEEPYGNT